MDSMDTSPPLVLVTGASGYIATHVVQQLQEQGYRVRGTVRSLQNATKVEPLRQLCPTAKYPIELVEADLTKPDSWSAAVKDCQYVMHVASPLPVDNPRDEQELIKPAVDGTLTVLRACSVTGTVKRVVLTSSTGTIECGLTARKDHVYSEADWTDIEKMGWVYIKSKTLAEKAAWDYIQQLPETDRFELAVINPSYVIGPVLCGSPGASLDLPRQLLQREIPMLANISFPCVDVRDVAAAHLAAMSVPEAAGHRHILFNENLWLSDIAKILSKEFGPQGYNVPTAGAPYAVLWLLSWFDQKTRNILGFVDTMVKLDNSRMKNVLKVAPRDIKESWLQGRSQIVQTDEARP